MNPPITISRQRRWQLKQNAAGCCIICGARAVTANHCLRHAVYNRERQRRNTGSIRRYRSLSYRLAKAA